LEFGAFLLITYLFIYYGSTNGLQTIAANPAGAAQRLESNLANTNLGSSVAGAGDLNGDGYADSVVGAQQYDTNGQTDNGAVFVYYGGASGGTAENNEGAVFVYYGSATGLQKSVDLTMAGAAQRLESNQANAAMGSSVAGAGDLNGDGYADLAGQFALLSPTAGR
jgi:hypothetical protein